MEFILLWFLVLDQKHTYLHSRMWYVQHKHTRVQAFTRYTSMVAINAKLKILTKMVI